MKVKQEVVDCGVVVTFTIYRQAAHCWVEADADVSEAEAPPSGAKFGGVSMKTTFLLSMACRVAGL